MNNPDKITFFAKTDARGQQVPFGIKAKDRTKHVYVIGKTGMGKSTLLENMAVQDMQQGNGLAFIDPHGATAQTLLNYVPEDRVDDVFYFAPFDADHPISFNVMEDVGEDKRHLVVSGLMSVFKKIWVDAWSARMEYILSNVLLALLEYPDSTLLSVNRMLSDKHYRKQVVDNITDPAVRSFWVDEFANYNERYMQEAGDAIKNKIGQFTSNPIIRNIVGQPKSSFDIRKLMDDRKILIANLSKGLVGESNANLLGSMLTTRIYLAAMSRADLNAQQLEATPNFYFYVDEFQSFANATFADILSEARKYKLNLTIAHQYIEQMEEEVRNAVFGNVGTIISFRVGPFDAEILETIFTPRFLAADIVNLGFAQIYLTLMIDGIGSPPFSAITMPPIEPPAVSYADIAIAQSQQRYAKDRASVETAIKTWHATNFTPPKNNGAKGNTAQSNPSHKRAPSARQHNTKQNGGPANRNVPRERSKPESVSTPRTQDNKTTKQPTSTKPPVADVDDTNEKKLSELRSVLQTITSKEVTPEKKNKSHNSSSKNEKKKDSTNEKGDHKDALKQALSAALDKPQTPPTKKNPVSKPAPTESKSKVTDVPSLKKETNEEITPAQLEKMMRVTGSDKNPLG